MSSESLDTLSESLDTSSESAFTSEVVGHVTRRLYVLHRPDPAVLRQLEVFRNGEFGQIPLPPTRQILMALRAPATKRPPPLKRGNGERRKKKEERRKTKEERRKTERRKKNEERRTRKEGRRK